MLEAVGTQTSSLALGVMESLQVERLKSRLSASLQRTEDELEILISGSAEDSDLELIDSVQEGLTETLETVMALEAIVAGP